MTLNQNAPRKVFSAGDGETTYGPIYVHKGKAVRLWSEGWDCAANDKIEVWYIPYIPVRPECEDDPIVVPFMERISIDACTTIDVMKVRLTKNAGFGIISEPGVYALVRACGAEDVTVWAQTVGA